MNKFTIVTIAALLLSLVSVTALAQAPSTENLSNLMGALGQAINNKTEVPGTNEAPAKLTPPAEKLLQSLENDLELCQESQTQEPQSVIVEKDGVKVEFKTFDLRIHGEKCPLEVNVGIKATEQAADNLQADFTMSVVFKTDAYIQKYKIKYVEASGKISAKALKNGAVVSVPVHVTITSKGESIDIGAFSQMIAMDVRVDANMAAFQFGMLMEQKAEMTYSGKTTKGYSKSEMTGFAPPSVFFSIDDKQVSESEFQTFMQTFVIPGMVSEEDPDAPDAKQPTQCTFAVFDKKSISAADLKTQILTSNLQKEGRLAMGQSCLKDLAVPFKFDNQEFSGKLSFGNEWVSFGAASQKDPQAMASSVYVLYGDEAAQTKETDSVIMGLQCKAVAVCQ